MMLPDLGKSGFLLFQNDGVLLIFVMSQTCLQD